MRERKWRVWALGKMYYPDIITFDANGATFAPDDMGGGSIRTEDVMEFTGLVDSAGNPIWEGDVLLDEEGVFYAEWDSHNNIWATSDADNKCTDTLASWNEEAKVIGNVFEHSHLLNEEQP